MNLHDQMKANSLFENENMLDTFIKEKNNKHNELKNSERKNIPCTYDKKLRKEILTVENNIEIVKAYIYKIL